MFRVIELVKVDCRLNRNHFIRALRKSQQTVQTRIFSLDIRLFVSFDECVS
jgi:hypothetical protein